MDEVLRMQEQCSVQAEKLRADRPECGEASSNIWPGENRMD
jgi:hypothetical protein